MPMSTDESSSSESESSASSPSVERRQRRPRASATLPEASAAQEPQEAQEASTSATTTRRNEVRGSMGGGGGEFSARPSAGASAGRSKPVLRPIYQPQSCHLCKQSTVYLTRSGLSDHTTIHHGHWYNAKHDQYVPIPEVDLEAKCWLNHQGQSHRKLRRDPADAESQTAGQDRPPWTAHRMTGLRMRSREAATTKTASPPDTRTVETRIVEQRPRSPSSRRVTSCTVDLGAAWYAPSAAATATGTGTATGARRPEPPFFWEGTRFGPAS